ncbi:MAG: NADH:ubiquinone reductase (Na(+)-transporting) subunit B [Chlorobi bacterium]|nr:NADH:ubiquinone reductase (Na(+)-transporting) subunit B [Chlorobiota bacterium]
MKGLEKYFEKIKPNFEKGGKYEKWGSVFESFETFLFVPAKTAPVRGAHIRDAMDTKRLMSVVVIALIPSLLFGMWNVGYQHFLSVGQDAGFWQNFSYGFVKVMPLVLVSYIAGLGTEFVFVYLKKKEIEEGFLVSGLLIPLILPVDIPLWMVAVATVLAVIFGKEVFGGTGMNVFNPALLARAFLFFGYAKKMSGDKVWIAGLEKGQNVVDGFSGATPLSQFAGTTKEQLADGGFRIIDGLHDNVISAYDMFMGWIPGSIGETSTLMILIGAAILLYTGVASWKIMLSGFLGASALGLLLNALPDGLNPYFELPFYYHLVSGGLAFGIVFMATDPVTSAQTEKGKWIYGFLIGVLIIIIRVFNPGYPEGTMLAILLMNAFAPLIDHYIIRANVKKRMKRIKVNAA